MTEARRGAMRPRRGRGAASTVMMVLAATLMAVCGCQGATADRVALDRKVGVASNAIASIEVRDGAAAVRAFGDGAIELWAQAPVFTFELVVAADAPAQRWTLTVLNAMPDGELRGTSSGQPVDLGAATVLRASALAWDVPLEPGVRLELTFGPPDGALAEPFRFAVLSDIQDGIDTFQEIVTELNDDPSIRFVASTGDLVSTGERDLLERVQRELETLQRPLFSTIGNHEMIQGDPRDWFELFGRTSFHFVFKDVHFSFIDSASGTVDPAVYDLLGRWLTAGEESVHIVATHIPPHDPVGLRSGAFASRKEAAMLLARLARRGVDLTVYGHLHSYYAFSNAGIPAYISGGGGAIPEKFDGIGRHFLVVDVDPGRGTVDVGVRRVD